jgi:hypothetical protein
MLHILNTAGRTLAEISTSLLLYAAFLKLRTRKGNVQ